MTDFFRNFQIDRNSFWLGFAAGVLFLWVLSRLRAYLPGTLSFLKKTFQDARESLTTGIETRYLHDVVRFAQHQHLTAVMFSLDEVAVEPRILAPPAQVGFSSELQPLDAVNLTVPYAPDWPELAAIYHTPTITILEAMQNGANLVITGHPGSGKSCAIALLASQLARRDPQAGALFGFMPLYIHARDIIQQLEGQAGLPPEVGASEPGAAASIAALPEHIGKPLDILIDGASRKASPLTQARLPALIRQVLDEKRAILLLDGMDELPPAQNVKLSAWLGALLNQYPALRVVAAASFDDLAGLPGLGLFPVAVAAWDEKQQGEFIQRWEKLWVRHVLPAAPPVLGKVSLEFIRSWLSAVKSPSLPLFFTLKVWGAYAGDVLGCSQIDILESYLRRMTVHVKKARPALEQFAVQMLLAESSAASPGEVDRWISAFVQSMEVDAEADQESTAESVPVEKLDQAVVKVEPVISALSNSGLLVRHPGARIGFSHPVIAGCLAGRALSDSRLLANLQEQTWWSGKSTALAYAAFYGDVTPVVTTMLKEDDFLYRNQLNVARWLQMAPLEKPWRANILRSLATLAQKASDTPSLGIRVTTALALSGEKGVVTLLRNMLKSTNPNSRMLAALGCGLLGDTKAVADLIELIQDLAPSVARSACLALVAIGDKYSLEVVATALMRGNEQVQRAAAEALANHIAEGHPALKDGSTVDDLMVRRAVVFGLMRIREAWALQILQNLQLEDKEYHVRNAAIQAMEELNRPFPYSPRPFPDLTELYWLILYAGKQGIGLSPGKPSHDLLLKALHDGTEDERLAAIEYLQTNGTAEVIPNLYQSYSGSTGDIHDAAFRALWNLAAAGVLLPSPLQYG